jgi:hypothetical protein
LLTIDIVYTLFTPFLIQYAHPKGMGRNEWDGIITLHHFSFNLPLRKGWAEMNGMELLLYTISHSIDTL